MPACTLYEHQQLRLIHHSTRTITTYNKPSINLAACLGNPLGKSTPTSVLVPPISATRTSFPLVSDEVESPARNEAPLIEFVAPLEKVLMGSFAAEDAVVSVPSFWT